MTRWIRVDVPLRRHPKTSRLMRRLGVTRSEAVGIVVNTWSYVAEVSHDGSMRGIDASDLAFECGYRGDAADLMAGLVEAGFVDCDDAGEPSALHEWSAYQGTSERIKAQAAERQRRKRAREQGVTEQRDSNARDVSRSHAPTIRYDTGQNGKTALKKIPLVPEKSTGGEPRETTARSPQATGTDAVVESFECAGKTPRRDITAAEIEAWQSAFPALDVRDQLRQMRAWLDANPARRKTARGFAAFVVSWLARSQNRGVGANGTPARQPRLDDGCAPRAATDSHGPRKSDETVDGWIIVRDAARERLARLGASDERRAAVEQETIARAERRIAALTEPTPAPL